MPDSEIRRAVSNRREGRRSHSAYGSHARGSRATADGPFAIGSENPRSSRRASVDHADSARFSAGVALALVYPFVRRIKTRLSVSGAAAASADAAEGKGPMKRKPSIKSLETLGLDEAISYLEHAGGDELNAAYALAWDRNRLDGSHTAPDEAEVHHALFMLCRA